MQTEPQYLFSVAGDTLTPTDLVRGPWDPGFQHGGAVCGALGWAVQRTILATEDRFERQEPFRLCRLTTEILRPVPVAPVRVRTEVTHNGKRSRMVAASLWYDDRCVARASSQWARSRPLSDGSQTSDVPASDPQVIDAQVTSVQPVDPAVPRRPVTAADPGRSDFDYPRPGFNCDVFELRPLYGSTEEPGPGLTWVRMTKSLMADQAVGPVQLLCTLADLGNAVGWDHSPSGMPMVNPDLTLQLLRYPRGEWVCLESSSRSTADGIGMMDTTLWDGDGRIGRVLSTTMESPMPLAALPTAGQA